MTIYIVFEYAESTNKIIGVYRDMEQAKKVHHAIPYMEIDRRTYNTLKL